MQVECDPKKSAANLKKHGVSFQEAETVFYDPLGLTCEDDEAKAKQGSSLSGWADSEECLRWFGRNAQKVSA